jgi:carbon-monoxide dehydrogenase medium subunit
MKAVAFGYTRPRDMRDALVALSQAETAGEAKIIAGGQSLGPMLNLRLARPKILIDISGLDALNAISDDSEAWRLGALVTHARLEDEGKDLRGCGFLAMVAGGIAFRSVRNCGTIGGSMAHADPAADWPLALSALDAVLLVRSAEGERSIPADRFMTAAFTTALRDDEMIEAVLVPKLSMAARFGYFKYCRKVGEFAVASAAAVFDPERQFARVFVGALHGAPVSLPSLARDAAERGLTAATSDTILAAVAEVAPSLNPIERRMHAEAVRRAIQQAVAA